MGWVDLPQRLGRSTALRKTRNLKVKSRFSTLVKGGTWHANHLCDYNPVREKRRVEEDCYQSVTVTSIGAMSAKVPHLTLRVTLRTSSLG